MQKISEKNKKIWEGTIQTSKNYGEFKILLYESTKKVHIKFLLTGTETIVTLGNIKAGSVKDPMYPNVYNVGYFGIGNYISRSPEDGHQYTSYKRWKEMLSRCYNEKCSSYKNYGAVGITVCNEWHNYQNFAKWWEENCLNEEYVIDKDLLYKNNKIYGPEYCCFIPMSINSLLTKRQNERGDCPIGVRRVGKKFAAQINYMGDKKYLGNFDTKEDAFLAYKKEKEKCIKEYADKYKDLISKKVYNALYAYQVEITD